MILINRPRLAIASCYATPLDDNKYQYYVYNLLGLHVLHGAAWCPLHAKQWLQMFGNLPGLYMVMEVP